MPRTKLHSSYIYVMKLKLCPQQSHKNHTIQKHNFKLLNLSELVMLLLLWHVVFDSPHSSNNNNNNEYDVANRTTWFYINITGEDANLIHTADMYKL